MEPLEGGWETMELERVPARRVTEATLHRPLWSLLRSLGCLRQRFCVAVDDLSLKLWGLSVKCS